MQFDQFISWFPLVFVGAAALTSLISFSHQYPNSLKGFSLLWIFNFCVDLTGHILKHLHIRNHWLYNIYDWIFFICLANLYYRQIKNSYIRALIRGFNLAFPLLIVADTIFIENIMSLQSIIIIAGGGFIIFLAAAYFYQMYMSMENEKITRDPWFWFSFGFIVYFGGTVPFMGMLNYLWEINQEFTNAYYRYISNSFAILMNILVIAGFLCRTNYQKSL
jgi:uncharacterized membrane protein YidH (DUF202 family)